MKLKDLAKKASGLPDLKFDWMGVENYTEYVLHDKIKTKEGLRTYVKQLRNRMSEQSDQIVALTKAYHQLKEIILEVEVGE